MVSGPTWIYLDPAAAGKGMGEDWTAPPYNGGSGIAYVRADLVRATVEAERTAGASTTGSLMDRVWATEAARAALDSLLTEPAPEDDEPTQ